VWDITEEHYAPRGATTTTGTERQERLGGNVVSIETGRLRRAGKRIGSLPAVHIDKCRVKLARSWRKLAVGLLGFEPKSRVLQGRSAWLTAFIFSESLAPNYPDSPRDGHNFGHSCLDIAHYPKPAVAD
jgi:hypothetical protein